MLAGWLLALTALLIPLGLLALWLLPAERRGQPPLQFFFGSVPIRDSARPAIIFYAVSHGELLLLERILPQFAVRHPDCEPVVIVPASSVERLARQRLPATRVLCLRPAAVWAARRALASLAPQAFVVVEFARIHQWIAAARELQIPLIIVNGRFAVKNQRLARWRPQTFRKLLESFDRILVQSDEDVAQFMKHGARPASLEVTGILKFDTARFDSDPAECERLRRLAGIRPDDVVFVAGSTGRGEEKLLLPILSRLVPEYPQLRVVIAPRKIYRFDQVARLLRRGGVAFQRRTQAEPTPTPQPQVLLLDTFGELAAWWGIANIGFVGESLTVRGGHNLIEPAALGVATCTGPFADNFRDVTTLLQSHEAAVEVRDASELESFLRRCLDDPVYASFLGARGRVVCRRQRGALKRTLDSLDAYLAGATPAQNVNRRAA